MVVSDFDGQNFTRCSYSSVNFGDDYECNRRYRHKCKVICKGPVKRVILLTLKVVIALNLFIFVIFPIIFKYSYSLQRKAVFLNFGPITLKIAALVNLNLPTNNNYSDPALFGLEGARNLYVDHDDVKLGVWQILPAHTEYNKTDEFFDKALSDGQDVILYSHGNAGSRATPHRVELYKFLSNFFHVITYDYRGYGDSADVAPTEEDVASDCAFMVKWIRSKVSPDSHIFLWGHSLGSSVTLAAAKALKKLNYVPTGIILEAPFNNFRDEIGEFPLASLFSSLPWFNFCVVEPLEDSGFRFESDKYILDVDSPILILHAEDDSTVPFKLGKKLYEIANEKRLDTQGSVQLQSFPKRFHYGHKNIIKSPQLRNIIENFARNAINETNALRLKGD